MALFKKPTEEDKIRSEIENIKFKKNAILSGISNEKLELERQKSAKIMEIGNHVYQKAIQGQSDYQITEYLVAIQGIMAQMAEKDKKHTEMSLRYDEEISMLETNLAMYAAAAAAAAAPAPVAASGGGFCDQCGAGLKGGDVFCTACGAKVER